VVPQERVISQAGLRFLTVDRIAGVGLSILKHDKNFQVNVPRAGQSLESRQQEQKQFLFFLLVISMNEPDCDLRLHLRVARGKLRLSVENKEFF
jgi:hypothetical protein